MRVSSAKSGLIPLLLSAFLPLAAAQAAPSAPLIGALGNIGSNNGGSPLRALPVLRALTVGHRGPLGVTLLQESPNGAGIGDVLTLGRFSVIGDQLDGVLVTPLLGLDGNRGLADLAVLEGDRSALLGPNGLLAGAILVFAAALYHLWRTTAGEPASFAQTASSA